MLLLTLFLPIIERRNAKAKEEVFMDNPTGNTNELDSYGVWVKRPPQDSNEDTIIPETEEKTSNIIEEDFDLPDFSDIPEPIESDELKDNPFTEEESKNDDGNIELSSDISLDDFLDDSASGMPGSSENTEEIDLDSFVGDSSGSSEEISLDDFLDGDDFGSSSSSEKEDDVANDEALDISLNFNTPKEDEVQTEEISEETDYDSDYESEPEPEESVPEKKVDFSSIDTGAMEEISLDDFSMAESDAATADAAAKAISSSVESEDVDLTEFGTGGESHAAPKQTVIDYDLAITEDDEVSSAPVIKEIKTDAKAEEKETTTENTAINNELLERIISDLSGLKDEISNLKNDFAELREKSSIENALPSCATQENEAEIETPATEEPSGFFGNSDEDETIALSGDELSNIMNSADFTEEVVENVSPDAETKDSAEGAIEEETSIKAPEPLAETPFDMPQEKEEIEPEPANSEDAAYSGSYDASETIGAEPVFEIGEVKSEPEPDSVDFSDSFSEPSVSADLSSEPEVSVSDDFVEMSPTEDFGMQEEIKSEPAKPQAFEENEELSDEAASASDIPETIPDDIIDEPAFDDSLYSAPAPLSEESGIMEEEVPSLEEPQVTDVFETEPGSEVPFGAEEEPDSGLSLGMEPETEEPNLEIMPEDSLPEEINIPKVDEILPEEISENADDIMVDSNSSDFMESVKIDETEKIRDPFIDDIMEEPPAVEDAITDENVEYLAKDENAIVDTIDAPIPAEEPAAAFEEPLTDTEREPSETASISEEKASESGTLPDDIKSDIKSVLLYMDQLLENLPEDKIMEFAKSEQFVTYKKLFSELGLS